jgi:hypothetical protein
MAFRDRPKRKVTPLLEPGEQLQFVFTAQGGVNPWIGNCGLVLRAVLVKPRVVAVTDRAIVVMRANFNSTSPKTVLARLPRDSRIGPVKGMWAKIKLGGEKLYVGRGWHKDVRAADALLVS